MSESTSTPFANVEFADNSGFNLDGSPVAVVESPVEIPVEGATTQEVDTPPVESKPMNKKQRRQAKKAKALEGISTTTEGAAPVAPEFGEYVPEEVVEKTGDVNPEVDVTVPEVAPTGEKKEKKTKKEGLTLKELASKVPFDCCWHDAVQDCVYPAGVKKEDGGLWKIRRLMSSYAGVTAAMLADEVKIAFPSVTIISTGEYTKTPKVPTSSVRMNPHVWVMFQSK